MLDVPSGEGLDLGDATAAAATPYLFDPITSPTVPGTVASGALRLDNADPAAASLLFINKTDSEAGNQGPEIASWDASGTLVVTIRSVNGDAYAQYYIGGVTVDSGTYFRLNLTLKASSGVFIDGEQLAIDSSESLAAYLTILDAISTYLALTSPLVVPGWTAASSAAAIAGLDLASSYNYRIAADANFTLAIATPPPDGSVISLEFVQTGDFEVVFPTSFGGGLCTGIAQEAGSLTMIRLKYDATSGKYVEITLGRQRDKVVAGTTYTIKPEDHGTTLCFTHASGCTVTGIAIAGRRGICLCLLQDGGGTVTFNRASSDTIGVNALTSVTTSANGDNLLLIGGASGNWKRF